MDINEKIDAIHLTVTDMKPKLEFAVEGIRGIDARLRTAEFKVTEHDVEVRHLETNVAGLWRRLRNGKRQDDGSKWKAIAEFASAIPLAWKAMSALVLALLTIIGMLLGNRHQIGGGIENEKVHRADYLDGVSLGDIAPKRIRR